MRTVLVILLVVGVILAVWFVEPVRQTVAPWIPGMEQAEASPTPPQHQETILPKEVALVRPVDMPAVVEGRTAGTLTVPAGTVVKVVKVEGSNLRLRYRDSVIVAPRASTDYNQRVKVVVVLDPAPLPAGETPVPTPTPEPSPSPKAMWTPQPSGLDTRALK